ncbi:MAG: hypothetical protein LBP61_01790 [Desulfovibrio sp.]|jgi:hypothetical protein|nr:hypothetical protein [Desulfovibrio sp.]
MSLQSQVYLTTNAGVPGMKADANEFDYYPQSLAAEGDVPVGAFVWPGTAPGSQGKKAGTGVPLGLVERNIVYPNYDPLEDGSAVVPDGETLTVATAGAFYAVTGTAATVGQKVFAVLADGSLKTAAAGATVTGAVETEWKVITAGAAGETIIIKRS